MLRTHQVPQCLAARRHTCSLQKRIPAAQQRPAPTATAKPTQAGFVHQQQQQQQHLTAAREQRDTHPQREQESPEELANDKQFNWHQAWYPVAVVSQLDKRRPTPVQLLGIQMVIWNSKGNWVVFADRCPHRFAPLSEGRLHSDGRLMCSYHGWQFDSNGACAAIPQIADAAAHKTACSSKKSCATRYPSQVVQGLLWVWLDTKSADVASTTAAALIPEWQADDWTMLGGDWFMRDLEYGYDTLMENLFDPSHVPFAHHGIMGSTTRDQAIPMDFQTVKGLTAVGAYVRYMLFSFGMEITNWFGRKMIVLLDGFQLKADSLPFKSSDATTTIGFVPPALNSMLQTYTTNKTSMLLTFYSVPTSSGKSKIIMAFFINKKVPQLFIKLAATFDWVFHLVQHEVLDSDAMLLHVQERLLHDGRDSDWRTAFYLPASADAAVIKFRQWYTGCAGGTIPWHKQQQQQQQQQHHQQQQQAVAELGSPDLGPVKPREFVMDRYHQHVVHCKSCQRALKTIERLRMVLLGVGVLASVITITTAVVVYHAVAAGAGVSSMPTTTTAVDGGASMLAVGALSAVFSSSVVSPIVVALVCLVGYQLLSMLRQRFFFVDYVHAARA